MEVLVLSVKGYDFTNDNNEQVTGNKVSYIVEDGIDGTLGFAPMILNLDNSLVNGLKVVPAIYKFDFTMKTGRNNKPELVAKSIAFVAECNNLFSRKKVV